MTGAEDLLPKTGPLSVEEIWGPSRKWLEGVHGRLRQPGYARAFKKALVREAQRERPGAAMVSTVQGQLDRLWSFMTGRPVEGENSSTSINIVSLADVPAALRSAERTRTLASEGRNPPRLVLAGADEETVLALRTGVSPGLVDVVSRPVAAAGRLNPLSLAQAMEPFGFPVNGRLVVYMSKGIGVDSADLEQLDRHGLEEALRRALLDFLRSGRLSPVDFQIIIEVVSHIRTNA
ncbi:MAG: hypothetical protein IPN90_04610 [Elusimicrobia bacterium]|nr:hypothetical protein [Elusimicrobiota bacterium]